MTPRLTAATQADVPSMAMIAQHGLPDCWSQEGIDGEVSRTDSECVVMRAGHEIRSFACARWLADELHILAIASDPRWRRQGYAAALLRYFQAQLVAAGGGAIVLEVGEHNTAARRLYRDARFGEVARRPQYYGSSQENALVMSWTPKRNAPEQPKS